MVEDKKTLIANRGYAKATLTRLMAYVSSAEFETDSKEAILARAERARNAFAEYEKCHRGVLILDPADATENVEEIENKYITIISKLNHASANTAAPVQGARVNLPAITIQPFDGKLAEYIQFINLFKSLIHNDKSLDLTQKLYYLKSYLRGEPLDLINNLPLLPESYTQSLTILEKRYENKFQITQDHISGILDYNPIHKCNSINIREFVAFITQKIAALSNINNNFTHSNDLLLCILLRKIDANTARDYQLGRNPDLDPSVKDFLEFLTRRATAMESVEHGITSLRPSNCLKVSAVTTMQEGPSCKYCKCKDHKLYNCKKFQLTPVVDRIRFVKINNLCNICLGAHKARCKYHFRCSECKRNHNTLLHNTSPSSPVLHNTLPTSPVSLSMGNNNKITNILLPTAKIELAAKNGKRIIMKALLDTGSQISLITSKALRTLDYQPEQNTTNISGVSNTKSYIKYSIPLRFHSLKTPFKMECNFHVVETITCKLPQRQFDLSTISLEPHKLADDQCNIPSNIDILLGADVVFQVLLPTTKQPAQSDEPCLIETLLGHIIGGNVPEQQKDTTQQVVLHCTSQINKTLCKFWSQEMVPQTYSETNSEHEQCESIFKESVKLENKQFEVNIPTKLPLQKINDALGNSFNLALKRFLNLEKKLHLNPMLFNRYKAFIDEYLSLEHCHYVDIESYQLDIDPVYFLPHHAVIKEDSKTTKLRTVFDGSMRTTNKISLNDLLLNGPVVQRDLFDIILLFRLGDFTFTADIKRMYRIVRVNPQYTSLQNILWRDNPNEPIKCLRLDTLTYGLKNSGYLATRCLKELASRYESKYPTAAFILNNCTFVDDILFSNNDIEVVIRAKAELRELLSLGSFETHKWSSNNLAIISDIPPKDQHFSDLELQGDNPSMKALGITVTVKNDKINISCPEPFKGNKITKRKVLSYIGKFHDPMGFASPITVTAKAIMQRIWAAGIGWGDSLPQCLRNEWLQFAQSLENMQTISIDRNIHIGDNHLVSLVGFSDASQSTGYGCCIYLRTVSESGKVSMNLICSKSRINPLNDKSITVPRLELNAAVLMSRLMNKVYNTLLLKIKVSSVYLFCDSKIVLAWLSTDPIKLQAYIANRVSVINKLTESWQWLYVSSKNNPADCVSRGADPQMLCNIDIWFHGPQFLHDPHYKFNSVCELPIEIPETRQVTYAEKVVCTSAIDYNNETIDRFYKFSSLNKAIRTLARVLRYCNNLRIASSKEPTNQSQSNFLTTIELRNALHTLIKHDQHIHFHTEIQRYNNLQSIKGKLANLHPFIDNKGLLRVSGRLSLADIGYEQKHPIILAKNSTLTNLIIRHEHETLLHAGPKLLLANLNQRYWIVSGLVEIKKVTRKCIICFRAKATASKQLMGSLPKSRITACRAFQRVGVDYAGPLDIKNSRLRKSVVGKGYICVFVCFVTKAIHLELSSDLTTASFLACFKRFIARRGLPTEVNSDNATNFKGARNQLSALYKLIATKDHQAQVQQFSSDQGIKFNFIPCYSPVFGGLWEAAVKSTKNHLLKTVKSAVLTFEEMYTVLTRIEAILNSRPLIPFSSNCNDYTYLTPGHFLVGAPLTSLPEEDVSNTPVNRLRLWNICNSMVQKFWKVWHTHYLNTLQCRPKWHNLQPNVCEGTLVLLKTESPSMQWPIARILKVFPGPDGAVRAFEVKTSNGHTYTTSITKVCPFPIDMADK